MSKSVTISIISPAKYPRRQGNHDGFADQGGADDVQRRGGANNALHFHGAFLERLLVGSEGSIAVGTRCLPPLIPLLLGFGNFILREEPAVQKISGLRGFGNDRLGGAGNLMHGVEAGGV